MPKITFSNKNNAFYANLKASVDQYFISHNTKKTGNWKLYIKTGTLIPAAILIYVVFWD
jgi:linoleoyl-CoA desaturase